MCILCLSKTLYYVLKEVPSVQYDIRVCMFINLVQCCGGSRGLCLEVEQAMALCSQLSLRALQVPCLGRVWAAEAGLGLCVTTLLWKWKKYLTTCTLFHLLVCHHLPKAVQTHNT